MRGAGSKERAPPGDREGEIRRRECEDFVPRNGATRVCGEGGSKERAPPSAWEVEIRRRKCEDFAPRNGATRVCGERGAKGKSHRATERAKSGGGNVKILLPGTELQGFAGRGEQREGAGGRPAGHTLGLAREYVQEKACIFIHNHVLSYQCH